MSETRRDVPWASGVVVRVGPVSRRPPETVRERTDRKRGQIAQALAALEGQAASARARSDERAAEALSRAIAFQRTRLEWLQEFERATATDRLAVIRQAEAGLSPAVLTALRAGQHEALRGQMSDEALARYALWSYLVRG